MNKDRLINRILIVEDSPQFRKKVKSDLLVKGYEIVEAGNGKQALQILMDDQNFDMILSDWNMPKIDGFELLKVTRAINLLENIPFILLSSVDVKDKIIEAAQNGLDNYMIKPFDINKFEAILARCNNKLSIKLKIKNGKCVEDLSVDDLLEEYG